MGLRFNLNVANWIAFAIERDADVPAYYDPQFPGNRLDREAVKRFLETLEHDHLYTSREGERDFHERVRELLRHFCSSYETTVDRDSFARLRQYFNPRDWTALLVPSPGRSPINDFLCSPSLLRTLVDAGSTDRGLVLQLEEPPNEGFSLAPAFPAFRVALERGAEWPGILLWRDASDAVFLPLPEHATHDVLRALLWTLERAGRTPMRNLEWDYRNERFAPTSEQVAILQLSDLHLGSDAADLRLPRLQSHVARLVNELRKDAQVLLIITGDLMDSPDVRHLDRVRAFLQFASSLDIPEPLVVLGNHDVRRDGYLDDRLRATLQIPYGSGAGVRWFESLDLGVVLFNSVVSGRLARGHVGERQLIDLATQIEQRPSRQHYSLVGAIHHHLLPIERPEWYMQPFYERVLGRHFERTDELEDARDVVSFVEDHRFAAILHGHKHIPRLSLTPAARVPVVGCGSSVGNVQTNDRAPFLSLAVTTINRRSGQVSARLLAENAVAGRLRIQESHEAMLIRRAS